jgi:hypothetical protein
LSANGTSTNVGSGSAVGDFSTLLLSINPALVQNIYPTSWTLYTVTVSGLSAPVSGRFAFRYFVTDGGNSGTNSDFIGIDQVRYTPVITPTAGIVYIKEGAIGNGSSWENPAGRLADAMVAAKTNTDVTQIWVAAGVYKPLYSPADINFGEADARNNAFLLVNNVKVYGGFAGTETLLTDRNLTLTANASILSGDLGTESVNTDNAYHVVISAGDAGTGELNGFTVKDGNADGTNEISVNYYSVYQYHGGGMYNSSSSPIITHVILSENNADSDGGGMNNSSPALTDVTLSGNNANNDGGGININNESSPTLTNVIISGNTANRNGGGIHINNYSSPKLTDVTINGNNSNNDGGGMHVYYNSSPTLANVIISENTANNNGGGMCNYYISRPILTNVTISGNAAINHGGGIFNTQSSPTLTDVTITGNTAIRDGGGIHNVNRSSPILINVTISENIARHGGGIYNYDFSSPKLAHVTIIGNTAITNGGGIHNILSSPTLTNVSISGNAANTYGGGMYNDNISASILTNVTISGNTAITNGGAMYNNSSAPMVRNSIIYGNNTGIVNNGNSSTLVTTYSLVQGLRADATNLDGATNPLFVNAPSFSTAPFTTGNYNLQANSPVINKGNNAYFDASQVPDLSAITTDLAGNPRLYGTTIDIGLTNYNKTYCRLHSSALPLHSRVKTRYCCNGVPHRNSTIKALR